jgi:hypothetical protein
MKIFGRYFEGLSRVHKTFSFDVKFGFYCVFFSFLQHLTSWILAILAFSHSQSVVYIWSDLLYMNDPLQWFCVYQLSIDAKERKNISFVLPVVSLKIAGFKRLKDLFVYVFHLVFCCSSSSADICPISIRSVCASSSSDI